MNIKYLIDYVEICTVLAIEPSFKGLERYKYYKQSKEFITKARGCENGI